MGSDYFGNQNNSIRNNLQSSGLLGAGWRPLSRQFDWEFFLHLVKNDSAELAQKTLDFTSDIADTLGRNHYTFWANILGLFSETMRYELDEFWEYITPELPAPDHRDGELIIVKTPVNRVVTRDCIPIDYVLNRLQEVTLFRILDLLGKPELVIQYYANRRLYYPSERFVSWERLEVLGTVYGYWSKQDVWLQIDSLGKGQRQYGLIANDIKPLVHKATYNVAVMLSGYQSRVGQVQSQFPIRQFPADIQSFTDAVQQAILDQNQLAVLVHGEPGTGKTAWTQAVAKEVLVPLGYVIFILDHDAVENFVPPSYLERIAIIINEADNLAQNRASEIAQRTNKTEHILSLLDGTLYQSVVEETGIKAEQKLVVLMTCNTTERFDPAMLRKGRVDLTCEFIHRFV
ncbi:MULTISPECIES: AAA family ATPase [unclassified Coleofasciculus]|uniref:AAA family ATPase n=1 Tax=unclassified Coleofasciculus TaxID=2692782 RepID=UPI001881A0EA|nr:MULTISPECIES: AAA family ATPase [unclassified Coleofasciculus]MBE9125059.1 AAA family ATPase [Coleofasciculus sp. LEGE 07081]MBE9151285.1 AAA family ATPase [Coleofasciculus sp. LEGE 07092]